MTEGAPQTVTTTWTFTRRRRSRARPRATAALLVGLLAAAGCGGGGRDGGGASATTATPAPTSTASGDQPTSTLPVMTAATVPAAAAHDGCPVDLPPDGATASEAIAQLVARRLAAVDGTNAACVAGLFTDSFPAAAIFTPTPVAVGVDPAAPTGQTAVRDQPGTRLVGPVVIDLDLTRRLCGDLVAGQGSDVDDPPRCVAATYPMRMPDGRSFTEFAHAVRGSLVFEGGRLAYDGEGPWEIAFYGFASAPA